MSLTKIGSIGINTGIQFAGVTTVSTLHVGSGVTLSSDGDIFATGISTFSEDIKVGSGVTISPDGDGFYTGVVTATTFSGALAASNLTGALPAISAANLTNVPAANITGTLPAISGANLTNLDASDLASGTVPTARLGSGTASSSTFLRGDSTFAAVTSTTINSNADNRLITGSGTANTLNGESTLTYDGDGLLSMTSSSGAAEITLVAPSSSDSGIYFNDGSNDGAISYDHSTQNMNFRANSQTKLRIEGTTKKLLIQRAPSSDVDITVARAQRWGYSDSYQGLIIGNPAVGTMSSLFLNYDPSSNTSGSFAGDGREMVVRKNAKMIVPNAADNAFYNAIEFNAGGDRDDGVSRFRQGILVSNDSADANVLDDYEEGSWTPSFGNLEAGTTYSTQYGRYCRVGSMIQLVGQITASGGGLGSDGSAVNIQGLPVVGNSAAEVCSFTFGRYTSLIPDAKLDDFNNVRFGGNYVMLHEGNNTDIAYSECNSSGTIQFHIAYIINT